MALAWLFAACCLAGCNLIGVVAHKSLPPPRVPAVHELAKAPTEVVVRTEAMISGEQGPLDAETVEIALSRALVERADVDVVEQGAGQRVDVVLSPPSTSGTIGSEYEQGDAWARVRVLDAAGEELWPRDGSTGFIVSARTPRVRVTDPAELRRATLRALGDRIAALFHSREMRPEEGL
jgi:hypothetical protein